VTGRTGWPFVSDRHTHDMRVIASTRTASGDWLVVRRCGCGIERHSTEDEEPNQAEMG
jgi:hypothetical protein